jgi:hypothetical protein
MRTRLTELMVGLVGVIDRLIALVLQVLVLVNEANWYDHPWIVEKVPLSCISPPPEIYVSMFPGSRAHER